MEDMEINLPKHPCEKKKEQEKVWEWRDPRSGALCLVRVNRGSGEIFCRKTVGITVCCETADTTFLRDNPNASDSDIISFAKKKISNAEIKVPVTPNTNTSERPLKTEKSNADTMWPFKKETNFGNPVSPKTLWSDESHSKFEEPQLRNRIMKALHDSSVDVPDKIAEQAIDRFFMYFRIEGARLTVETDFGRRISTAAAKTEDDMFYWVMHEVCKDIAHTLEMKNREREAKNWRYMRGQDQNGSIAYIENRKYKYNALQDTRKMSFEYEINLIRDIFSGESADSIIRQYETLMNSRFPDAHWCFDHKTLEFIEVSDSKEITFEKKNIITIKDL